MAVCMRRSPPSYRMSGAPPWCASSARASFANSSAAGNGSALTTERALRSAYSCSSVFVNPGKPWILPDAAVSSAFSAGAERMSSKATTVFRPSVPVCLMRWNRSLMV